jgi:DNA modification methylase
MQLITSLLGRESVHPFPARMAPDIVLESLANSKNPLRVLDPMSGSGTVPALARSLGHRAFGLDVDPLAVLMARVWTRALNCEQFTRKAAHVLSRAKKIAKVIPATDAFPVGADQETRRFLNYWFDACARKQLTALSLVISRVHSEPIRDALWCAFSRLIITKQAGASRAMDLSHSRPHRYFRHAPVLPFDGFERSVERVARSCIGHLDENRGPAAIIRRGDARRLPLQSESIDLVVTSPPYLNAIDYMRCSKFSLVWMNYTIDALREMRASSVGTEIALKSGAEYDLSQEVIRSLRLRPKLSNRQHGMLSRYVNDMRRSVNESARVLAYGGRAIYVVGENTVRGTFIPNSRLIEAIAENAGLRTVSVVARNLPPSRRYMPPPKRDRKEAGLNVRMRREVVLSFAKPKVAGASQSINWTENRPSGHWVNRG